MKIYFINGNAFFELSGSNYLICIGTQKEVEEASAEKLERMIWEAFAVSRFNETKTKGERYVH